MALTSSDPYATFICFMSRTLLSLSCLSYFSYLIIAVGLMYIRHLVVLGIPALCDSEFLGSASLDPAFRPLLTSNIIHPTHSISLSLYPLISYTTDPAGHTYTTTCVVGHICLS